MFTWVCQRCGKEVDVAEVECPHCAVEMNRSALGSAQGADRRPIEEDVYPAEKLPPAQRAMRPPTPAPLPPPQHALAIRPLHLFLFALVLAVSLAGAIYLARPDLMTVEGVSLPRLPRREAPPLQQGPIEIAGIRTWRDEQAKLRVRALLINHTAGPYPEQNFRISLRNPESEDEAPPGATFEIALEEPIGARASREVEAELIAPEGLTALPEWNRMRVEVEPIPAAIQ